MPNAVSQTLTLPGLVYREIRYRKWSFLLATLAVAAAAALILGSEALLMVDQRATVNFLKQKQEETELTIRCMRNALQRQVSNCKIRFANRC